VSEDLTLTGAERDAERDLARTLVHRICRRYIRQRPTLPDRALLGFQ
jgi:hypothetical protein